jgi:hypothetical protein
MFKDTENAGLHIRNRSMSHNLLRGNALLVFWFCGIAGVLVDIDHPISYLLNLPGRFLHTPLLIASSLVLCGCGAYLGGLLVGKILKHKRDRQLWKLK